MQFFLLTTAVAADTLRVVTKVVVSPGSTVVLEYLKVLVTFPLVFLISFLTFLAFFKEELKTLIKSIKSLKAGAVELLASREEMAEGLAAAVYKKDLTQIAELPDGPEKESKEAEVQQQVTMLERQLRDALDVIYFGSPYTSKDYGMHPPNMFPKKEITLLRPSLIDPMVRAIIEPIIKDHIFAKDKSSLVLYEDGSLKAITDVEDITQKCAVASPLMLKLYGHLGASGRVFQIANELVSQQQKQPPKSS